MICIACKRRLRSPESIKVGYGPICYERLFGKRNRKKKRGKNRMRIFYKCRACGKTFSDTTCSLDMAHFVVNNLRTSEYVNVYGSIISRHASHICNEGSTDTIGFADFLGIWEGDRDGER